MLIALHFLANIVEKEIDAAGTKHPATWRALEHIFNAIFLAELLVNLYAHWLWPFLRLGWNYFDIFVVGVGCVSFFTPLDGPLKLLRCLRALRIFRLFKRVKSLHMIIRLIMSALPAVASALLVMVLCVSMYSLLAVELFSQFGGGGHPSPDCMTNNLIGLQLDTLTPRNLCYGYERFGSFTRSWLSLFQVLTGDSWAEDIARPILFGWTDYGNVSIAISASFFISFVLINTFILFNVFVAVLLDKVIASDDTCVNDSLRSGTAVMSVIAEGSCCSPLQQGACDATARNTIPSPPSASRSPPSNQRKSPHRSTSPKTMPSATVEMAIVTLAKRQSEFQVLLTMVANEQRAHRELSEAIANRLAYLEERLVNIPHRALIAHRKAPTSSATDYASTITEAIERVTAAQCCCPDHASDSAEHSNNCEAPAPDPSDGSALAPVLKPDDSRSTRGTVQSSAASC